MTTHIRPWGNGDYSSDEARRFSIDNEGGGLLFARPSWQAQGACNGADFDLFFPERGASTRQAKEICGRCPVEARCLAWAMDNDERFGIWGGTSERERRRLRAARKAERGAA